jgi:hypothetical protein
MRLNRSRQFWVAGFAAHFLAIAAVSCWDLVNLVADGRTILPGAMVTGAARVTQSMKSISPGRLSRTNPLRQTVIGYCHSAGIESPYTFFAPNVPESLRVTFEIQFPDKRVSYELPQVQSDTEGLRVSALVDQAAAKSGLWREVVLQMLAAAVADNNPDATKIRVTVAALKFPHPADYVKGAEPSYQFVCSYDFVPAEARARDEAE